MHFSISNTHSRHSMCLFSTLFSTSTKKRAKQSHRHRRFVISSIIMSRLINTTVPYYLIFTSSLHSGNTLTLISSFALSRHCNLAIIVTIGAKQNFFFLIYLILYCVLINVCTRAAPLYRTIYCEFTKKKTICFQTIQITDFFLPLYSALICF